MKISKFTTALLVLATFALIPLLADQFETIVMVDITWSLHDKFREIEEYLLTTLLQEVLHEGDIFHLLWFSDKSEEMIKAEVIKAEKLEELKQKIIKLVNLQWPFGRYTDLISAVDYLIKYLKKLNPDTKKILILITDGIHDPPPGTNTDLTALEIKNKFMQQAKELKMNGWSIHFLKASSTANTAKEESEDFFNIFQEYSDSHVIELGKKDKQTILSELTGFAEVIFPPHLGKVGSQFKVPFEIKNSNQIPLKIELRSIIYQDTNLLLSAPSIVIPPQSNLKLWAEIKLPLDLTEGEQTLEVKLTFKDDVRVVGTKGKISFLYDKTIPTLAFNFLSTWLFPWGLLILIGAILLLAFIAILLRRLFLHSSFSKVISSSVHFKTGKHLTTLEADKRHSFAIEMVVSMQRRDIGHRNIHRLRKNRSYSIGGGNSYFLIFLIKLPAKIATIKWNGGSFIFKPLKLEFFPENSEPINDCLDKTIKAVSQKGYKLEISFHRYISPLEEINRIFQQLREKAKS